MANSIIETSKGFEVRVLIQDGTEYCGAYATAEEAVQNYKESQYFLNGEKNPNIPQVQYIADKPKQCCCGGCSCSKNNT